MTFGFLTGGSAQPPGGRVFPPDVIAAAQASHAKWKIPASVTLAQWALESNFGRAMPIGSIKAAKGQPFVETDTREVIGGQSMTVSAKFRKFGSLTEAFDQHGKLLATGRPYANARTLVDDPNVFADALTGVYATDPNYGASLKSLMRSHDLYQYD